MVNPRGYWIGHIEKYGEKSVWKMSNVETELFLITSTLCKALQMLLILFSGPALFYPWSEIPLLTKQGIYKIYLRVLPQQQTQLTTKQKWQIIRCTLDWSFWIISVWFSTQTKGFIQWQAAINEAEVGLYITCAENVSNFHAEDEAGLVSLSFSLLHHIHRQVATSGAVFMQNLYRCLPRVGPLWFMCIQAACIKQAHINCSPGPNQLGCYRSQRYASEPQITILYRLEIMNANIRINSQQGKITEE